MTTATQPAATLAARFGYQAGAAVRSARARVARLEAKCADSVAVEHGASGATAVRSLFLLGKVALVLVALAVSLWLAVTLLTLLVLAYAVAYGFPVQTKDSYQYRAHGDPYGHYEFGKAAGQPDLEDLP